MGGAPLADPLAPKTLRSLSEEHATLTATLSELFSKVSGHTEVNI